MNTMELKRLKLHDKFLTMCDNVYYQPPENLKIKYPCIVYSRNNPVKNYANNDSYILVYGYTVTVIDEEPDSDIVYNVSKMPKCSFNRHFTNDNLNHDVFIVYE